MTKRFACSDIGMKCGFKASAETEAELMEKIKDHARTSHGMATIDKNTLAKVKAAIR